VAGGGSNGFTVMASRLHFIVSAQHPTKGEPMAKSKKAPAKKKAAKKKK
jgi:hypothetical protein